MYSHVVGIDPGEHGYLSIVSLGSATVQTFAIFKDRVKMLNVLRPLVTTSLIAIEDVHALFGVAASSSFTFGRNLGKIEGYLESVGVDLVTVLRVSPTVWQNAVLTLPPRPLDRQYMTKAAAEKAKADHKTLIKRTSLLAASDFFPQIVVKTFDEADSLNIARYASMVADGKIDHYAASPKDKAASKKKRTASKKRVANKIEVEVGTSDMLKDTPSCTKRKST